ncbi:MAG: alpha/beta fold hydrolase [Pseudomonadota bacterium]
MPWQRAVIRLVAITAIFNGAAVAALFVFQSALLFPVPSRDMMIAEGFQPVTIESGNGRILRAIFRDTENERGAVIFFHGNGSIPSDEQGRARILSDAGFDVLLAGYSGYGGSDGQPSAENLLEDALASYDWIASKTSAPLFTYGSSLGTGLAVHTAANRDVEAIVLEAPYDELVAIAADRYPWVPVNPLFRNNIASVQQIGSLNMPILIMHGTRDATIPIKHGRALANAGGDTIDFVVFEGAGHSDLVQRGSLQRALLFVDEVVASL